MSVTLDRDTDLNSVAHLQLDFGDLNLFSPTRSLPSVTESKPSPTTFRSLTIGPDADDGVGD